jgi:mannose-1-phosphate guanylyltransferase/phosphomannomutase
MLEPGVLNGIEPGVPCDFSYDIFPRLLSQGFPLFGYLTEGYWCDMGTLPGYMKATADILNGRVKHVDIGAYQGSGVWTGQDVTIASKVKFQGPIYLGHGAKIGSDVTLLGPAVVGDGTVVEQGAWIERSIIGPNCVIGSPVHLYKATVPQGAQVTQPVVAAVTSKKRTTTSRVRAPVYLGKIKADGPV